jgi:hypothetical protein
MELRIEKNVMTEKENYPKPRANEATQTSQPTVDMIEIMSWTFWFLEEVLRIGWLHVCRVHE